MSTTGKAAGRVASVMTEDRVFPPPTEFSARARIGSLDDYRRLYDAAANDPEAFWHERALALPWMTPALLVELAKPIDAPVDPAALELPGNPQAIDPRYRPQQAL